MIGPLGFAGYAIVPPPGEGFWRVSLWSQVFDPPQPPAPLGASPGEDDGHRYDDPDGLFRTLYCATEAEGALGECLGDFVFNTAAVVRIEAFLESEPEPGFDEDYHRPLRPEDIKAFGWKLGHASARDAHLIDVEHWRTYVASAPRALPALGGYGIKRFDRQTLLDERRYITRGIWIAVHQSAAARVGVLGAVGAATTRPWAVELDPERVWVIEDCRHLSRRFEQALIASGERVVRVPPRMMGQARRGEREQGKSDQIDARAVARAVVREGVERFPTAFLDERALKIRLLADHRSDLVAERTRQINRLRWHLSTSARSLRRESRLVNSTMA